MGLAVWMKCILGYGGLCLWLTRIENWHTCYTPAPRDVQFWLFAFFKFFFYAGYLRLI